MCVCVCVCARGSEGREEFESVCVGEKRERLCYSLRL